MRFIKCKSVKSVTMKCQTLVASTFVVIQHTPENDLWSRNTDANLNVNKHDKQKLRLPRWIVNGMKKRYINIYSSFIIHLLEHCTVNVKFIWIRVRPLKTWRPTSIKNYTDRVIGFKCFTLDKFQLNSLPKFTLHILPGYLHLVGRWCADKSSHRR
jgi:hypothetical protein